MFDFDCTECKFGFEELISDDKNPPCPQCGAPTKRLVAAPRTTFRFADRKAFKTG